MAFGFGFENGASVAASAVDRGRSASGREAPATVCLLAK
jgi:hypothetical protein